MKHGPPPPPKRRAVQHCIPGLGWIDEGPDMDEAIRKALAAPWWRRWFCEPETSLLLYRADRIKDAAEAQRAQRWTSRDG